MFRGRISPETRAYARYLSLWQSKSLREIADICGISKSSAQRIIHSQLPGRIFKRKKRSQCGRNKKLLPRGERYVLRELRKLRSKEGSFSISRLMLMTGNSENDISPRTISNVMRNDGYRLYDARKKGLLSPKDFRKRVKFARQMENRPIRFWTDDVAFYLDGVTFTYKTNPHDQARAPGSKIYRKRSEGLSPSCTARGSKVGTGGHVAKFVVALTYQKGVIISESYEKMNGEYFESFVRRNFERMFELSEKDSLQFVQDGDPSQNSGQAKRAMEDCNAQLLLIPSRSPDINPIENFFHLVRRKLKRDALERNICYETFEQFQNRIVNTMREIPTDIIDRTIESIRKRLKLIIKGRGKRTKY